jgi:hypothetical protein
MLSCNRCKEECDDATNPECPNYVAPPAPDPCASKSEVSATFTVLQQASIAGNFLDTLKPCFDEILVGNKTIYLHAIEPDANYQWLIGSDTVYGQDYEFVVPLSFIGQNINIKLMVEKQPDTLCFPLDNGLDTITKTFTALSSCTSDPMGKWYGAWDDSPIDSFLIAFVTYDDPNDPGVDCGLAYIKGHHQSFTDSTLINRDGLTANYLYFRSTHGPQYAPYGPANVSEDDNHIVISYTMFASNVFPDNDWSLVHHVFRGYRIN